jgi:hypothetical protein
VDVPTHRNGPLDVHTIASVPLAVALSATLYFVLFSAFSPIHVAPFAFRWLIARDAFSAAKLRLLSALKAASNERKETAKSRSRGCLPSNTANSLLLPLRALKGVGDATSHLHYSSAPSPFSPLPSSSFPSRSSLSSFEPYPPSPRPSSASSATPSTS